MWQGWAVGSLLWLCVSCADGFIDGCIIMNFTQLFKIAPMTLLFIISFVVVMGIQLIQGVNIDEQTGQELIDYGANFLPLTLTDEPWRLVTAGLLHIGAIHLLVGCAMAGSDVAGHIGGMMMGRVLGLCHVMSCRLNKNAHRGSECVVWGMFALCTLVSVIVMMGAWQMMHGMVMRW